MKKFAIFYEDGQYAGSTKEFLDFVTAEKESDVSLSGWHECECETM